MEKTTDKSLVVQTEPQPRDLAAVALLVPAPQDRTYLVSWLLQFPEGNTRRSYLRHIHEFLSRFPGVAIKSFTVAHVTVFLEEKRHLAVSSQNLARNAVSSFFEFCVRSGFIDRNPAAVIRTQPASRSFHSRVLSEEEMQRLISFAHPGRDRTIFLLLYFGGLRVAELCELTWSCFHPLKDGGTRIVVVGKGNKSRSVHIGQELWSEIQSLAGDLRPSAGAHVFRSQMSDRLTPARVWQIVREAALRARIDRPVSPHWFRHGHASHALANGASLRTLQLTLGHASLVTTAQYLDAFPGESSGKYLFQRSLERAVGEDQEA